MDPKITAILRDILCSSTSLDDGLSALQNTPKASPEDVQLVYDIARALEEIILQRPATANYKLTEALVRQSFGQDPNLPEFLSLLDTRFTNAYRRSETEILPDKDAIPILLDILGELSQSMITSLRLNLRPLLPYLTDETLLTLEAIQARQHKQSTQLAVNEVHYITHLLIEEGLFECAEALLNRLLTLARDMNSEELVFDVTLDAASVLTELRSFEESKRLLATIDEMSGTSNNPRRQADVRLQLAVNETRDDSVPHQIARQLADYATKLYEDSTVAGHTTFDDVCSARLAIGSNILANGWREAVPDAIERLESALNVLGDFKDRNTEQTTHLFKCLASLGFAHGQLGDDRNVKLALDYLNRSKDVLGSAKGNGQHTEVEIARCENAIGWICLTTESDEFHPVGVEAFKSAVSRRSRLLKTGDISELEFIGSKVGLALTLLRESSETGEEASESLRESMAAYVPLFPTDTRAVVEAAIATYDAIWLSMRHGAKLSERLQRLLEDFDRIISEVRSQQGSAIVDGVSLAVPFMKSDWGLLKRRARNLAEDNSEMTDVSRLFDALATAKINVLAINLETLSQIANPVDQSVTDADPLLAAYWVGQTALAKTIRAFYENKNYSELATGVYQAAVLLRETRSTTTGFTESTEFICATAASLSSVLLRFALALHNRYGAVLDRAAQPDSPDSSDSDEYSFLLPEDWLGIIKITEAYLQMVEQAESILAQPYLNAVFSSIARAIRMMDQVAMVDRRVLAFLGEDMNRRFYLRR